MNSPRSLGLLAVCTACTLPLREAKLPPDSEGYVAVLSGEMPGAISQVARHSWIIVNVPGAHQQQYRFELQISGEDPFQYFGTGDVAVHGIVHYEPEELDEVLSCLRRARREYDTQHPDYFPIPGPNSNTIIDYLLRRCNIHVELPATAIGRDYRGPIGASVTSRGSGVQLETWVLGAKLGLEEGVELHLLDMPLGVHFWPPGITVPVNPGRIGFDTSGHRPATLAPWQERRRRREEREREEAPERPREYGLASLYLYSHYARIVDPENAGGLSDVVNVGFEGRAGYGTTLGYGFGFDLDAGMGFSPGFAYAARLYPLGLMLMLANDSFVGAFVGVGADGVGNHVPAAFQVPAELRLELDLAPEARIGASARTSLFSGAPSRRDRNVFTGLDDELLLSIFARFGTAEPCGCGGHMGRGYFFALERGWLLGSGYLGVKFGIQADFGG
jgi:hypothetical protein